MRTEPHRAWQATHEIRCGGIVLAMCNLYNMTPKHDLEVYWRTHASGELLIEDYQATTVGPFQNGVFLRPGADGEVVGQLGQWGLIRAGQAERIAYIEPKVAPGEKPRAKRPKHTNNARIEAIDGLERMTNAAQVWRTGRRCLVPATWYQEPNWETGKNIWWHLRRADGRPWFIAGLWSDDWVDPCTGEVVASYTMLTTNCDGHPLLARLHKPERDPKTREVLPPEKQDKRSLVHVDPANWDQWLYGSAAKARELIKPQPIEVFDMADAHRTDEVLRSQPNTGLLFE